MNVLVTGADGFIGKNLLEALKRLDNITVQTFTRKNSLKDLDTFLDSVDLIYHLAGVNRSKDKDEFNKDNVALIENMIRMLKKKKRKPTIIFSSSTQAKNDTPYGRSKRKAEIELIQYAKELDIQLYIYRLPNVFGKWCRPNYNSVVATFCYNISHDLEITINNPAVELDLVYIHDVIDEFIQVMKDKQPKQKQTTYFFEVSPVHKLTLQRLADTLYQFKNMRENLWVPDFSDPLTEALYSTYLSYLDEHDLSYKLDMKVDHRGSLAELFKSSYFGQIFVSKSKQGVVRGNHYHDHKVEKFCVINGQAEVKLRSVLSRHVVSYVVSGNKLEIIDIPPGYTHSLENLTDQELTVLFWANEAFDPKNHDTYNNEV